MTSDEKYMARCIELARIGSGTVSPNPMVGSLIVCNGKIIGEGYHRQKGGPHAEVFAIGSVKNQESLKNSILYVNLEPCSHFGSTPPCSDLILEKKIPKVVIGSIDTYAEVAGRGIKKLQNAGVEVVFGVLEAECRELNRRFFTFHEKKRPYIFLKWAQTIDGFIDIDRGNPAYGQPTWITGDMALRLVHKIRSEEDAILVGTNTAQKDNPSLTVRFWTGRNPIRMVIDKQLRLNKVLNLFDNSVKTMVFNSLKNEIVGNTEYVKFNFEKKFVPQLLDYLYSRNVLSVIVEGGRQLLESFILEGLWDEAHVFSGNSFYYSGVKAPLIPGRWSSTRELGDDRLFIFRNREL